MAKFAKWIAGGLGWAFGGPIGGIIGFLIGSALDGNSENKGSRGFTSAGNAAGSRSRTTTGGYAMSMLVLIAAVMKADGKTLKSELDYVKQFFVRNFGEESALEAIQMLRDILKRDIPLYDVCQQIRANMDYSSRVQMLHMLFGVSGADGEFHAEEVRVIGQIAEGLGVRHSDYESVKSMFIKNTDSAYTILGIERSATDDEVKKAYRKQAKEHHPDKVSHLGEDFQKAAKDKFQQVNEAYEAIKKERNLS